jgi:hypothetical protein
VHCQACDRPCLVICPWWAAHPQCQQGETSEICLITRRRSAQKRTLTSEAGADSAVRIDEGPAAIQYTPGGMVKRGRPSHGGCYDVTTAAFSDDLVAAGSEVSGMAEQYCSFRMAPSVKEAFMTFSA